MTSKHTPGPWEIGSDPIDAEKIEVLTLRTKRFVSGLRVDEHSPFKNVDIYMMKAWGEVGARMIVEAFYPAESVAERTIEAPADWWQAVKERWFPAWAKRRWPVVMRRQTLSASAVYTRVSLPEHKPYIHIEKRAAIAKAEGGEG